MTQDLLDSDGWSGLVERLPTDLDLLETARAQGAFCRARGVRSAEDLLRLALIYANTSRSLRSTAAWACSQDLANISDVALLLRLQASVGWLQAMVSGLLSQALQPLGSPCGDDRRVRLIDATTISSPGSGKGDWRLHAEYDLRHGRFIDFELTDRHGAESLERFEPAPGDIVVGDRIYTKVRQLSHVVERGADFIVRRGLTSCRLQHPDGQAVKLGPILKTMNRNKTLDLPVLVPQPKPGGQAPLRARLIIRHIGEEQAAEARQRTRRKAAKIGQTASDKRLEAAEFVILLTSLPGEAFSADQVLRIYRLRWQIECAFKRLKSLMGLNDLLAKEPRLVRSCLYAKLFLALITEDITCEVLESFPSAPGRPAAVDLAAPEPHL